MIFLLQQILALLIFAVLIAVPTLLFFKLRLFNKTQKKLTPKFLVFAVLLLLLFIILSGWNWGDWGDQIFKEPRPPFDP